MGRRNSRGVAVVELAFVLPIFVLLLLAILDFGRLFFTEITLQHALREGGRFGVTGAHLPNPGAPASLQSRVASIREVVRRSAIGVRLAPDGIVVRSVNGGADNAGGPGDTFTISLAYEFRFITPLLGQYFNDGAHRFVVSTTFRNEPFPPGQSS